MIERIRRVLIKEFLQMLRDPRMRAIVFVAPVLQMLVFAFALTTDVTDIRTAVLDEDNTPASREITQAFTAGGYFRIVARPSRSAELDQILDHGDARAAIRVPRGFESVIRGGGTGQIQLLVDGTDSNAASVVLGYANQDLNGFNERLARRAAVPGVRAEAVTFESRAWFNPNLESSLYFVPGLVAVMLMVVSVILTSIAVVREKEIGTIEQVMVTPIRGFEFILGKTLPYLITAYIVMTAMFAIAMLVFGVRMHGSWVLLYGMAGVYVIGNIGIALVVSVSARTQQQALLTAFLFLMPGVLLSGFMFPIRNMPEVVQWLSCLNPMRWFLVILRGIVLKGIGVRELGEAIAWQFGLALAFLALAVSRFRKTES